MIGNIKIVTGEANEIAPEKSTLFDSKSQEFETAYMVLKKFCHHNERNLIVLKLENYKLPTHFSKEPKKYYHLIIPMIFSTLFRLSWMAFQSR